MLQMKGFTIEVHDLESSQLDRRGEPDAYHFCATVHRPGKKPRNYRCDFTNYRDRSLTSFTTTLSVAFSELAERMMQESISSSEPVGCVVRLVKP